MLSFSQSIDNNSNDGDKNVLLVRGKGVGDLHNMLLGHCKEETMTTVMASTLTPMTMRRTRKSATRRTSIMRATRVIKTFS